MPELARGHLDLQERPHAARQVVVDYLQLIQGRQAGRDSSCEREISEISRGLKALAQRGRQI